MSVIFWMLLMNETSGDLPRKPKVLEIVYAPEALGSSLHTLVFIIENHNGETYSEVLMRHCCKKGIMSITCKLCL